MLECHDHKFKKVSPIFFYMSVIVASDCFDVSNPDPARMTWIRNLLSRTIIYLMIVTISNDLELECVEDRFDQSRYGVRRMVSIEDILPLNKGWNQRIYRTDTRTAPPPVVINWNVSPRLLWRQLYRQTGSAVNCRQSKERQLNLRRRGGCSPFCKNTYILWLESSRDHNDGHDSDYYILPSWCDRDYSLNGDHNDSPDEIIMTVMMVIFITTMIMIIMTVMMVIIMTTMMWSRWQSWWWS